MLDTSRTRSLLMLTSDGHVSGDINMIACCSAGVGRTGTYLAVDYLLSQATNERELDVYKHIAELRTQRMHSVQTLVTLSLSLSLSLSLCLRCAVPSGPVFHMSLTDKCLSSFSCCTVKRYAATSRPATDAGG